MPTPNRDGDATPVEIPEGVSRMLVEIEFDLREALRAERAGQQTVLGYRETSTIDEAIAQAARTAILRLLNAALGPVEPERRQGGAVAVTAAEVTWMTDMVGSERVMVPMMNERCAEFTTPEAPLQPIDIRSTQVLARARIVDVQMPRSLIELEGRPRRGGQATRARDRQQREAERVTAMREGAENARALRDALQSGSLALPSQTPPPIASMVARVVDSALEAAQRAPRTASGPTTRVTADGHIENIPPPTVVPQPGRPSAPFSPSQLERYQRELTRWVVSHQSNPLVSDVFARESRWVRIHLDAMAGRATLDGEDLFPLNAADQAMRQTMESGGDFDVTVTPPLTINPSVLSTRATNTMRVRQPKLRPAPPATNTSTPTEGLIPGDVIEPPPTVGAPRNPLPESRGRNRNR